MKQDLNRDTLLQIAIKQNKIDYICLFVDFDQPRKLVQSVLWAIK